MKKWNVHVWDETYYEDIEANTKEEAREIAWDMFFERRPNFDIEPQKGEIHHYLFECIDEESDNEGEEFIVGAETYTEAREIAEDNFGKVRYWHELTEEEAENSGLDEY